MLHKPVGFITTLHDPSGRRTVAELLPKGTRLFPVGRLDADTSGLLLFTNDGDLAHHLMHPRYGVPKVYRVRVDRLPTQRELERLRQGVTLEAGVRSSPADVRVSASNEEGTLLEVVLHEGRKRQVRLMCEAVGLDVRKLHRPAYGPLILGRLPRGAWRDLTDREITRLKAGAARPGGARKMGARQGPRPATRPASSGAHRDRSHVPQGRTRVPQGRSRLPQERTRPQQGRMLRRLGRAGSPAGVRSNPRGSRPVGSPRRRGRGRPPSGRARRGSSRY